MVWCQEQNGSKLHISCIAFIGNTYTLAFVSSKCVLPIFLIIQNFRINLLKVHLLVGNLLCSIQHGKKNLTKGSLGWCRMIHAIAEGVFRPCREINQVQS